MKPVYSAIITLGMILAGKPRSLVLERKHLRRHVAILGGSGQGKSKLLEAIMRQLENQGEGFTDIDPHGDTVKALALYFLLKGTDPKRIYYLRPGPDCNFSFDPFSGLNPDDPGYESALVARCERLLSCFVRGVSADQQEMMKRLRRWFIDIAFVCGYSVNGKYPGFSKALILTDPDREEFGPIFEAFRSAAKGEQAKTVLADFEKVIGTKNAQQREKWLESTINLLREKMSPAVREMFDQRAPSIDFQEVIRNKGILLVDLQRTDYLSTEQGRVIGGIVANFLIYAAEKLAETTPPELRTDHMLIIDEAPNFIGEDIRMGFTELRKFGLSLCICGQNLASFRKGDLDLGDNLLSQCGVFITFEQSNPEDVEELAKKVMYGCLDMTPLYIKAVLPDGFIKVGIESESVGFNCTMSESEARSLTHTHSTTRQEHTAHSIQESVSHAFSESEAEGTNWGEADSITKGRSTGQNWQEGTSETNGTSKGKSKTTTNGNAHTTSHGTSAQDSSSHSDAHSSNRGETRKFGDLHPVVSKGHAQNKSTTSGSSSGTSTSNGSSTTHSEAQGETEGQTHGTGRTSTEGGSETVSEQEGRTASRGGSRTKTIGKTVTTGNSTGTTQGKSTGVSDGESTGNTSGTTVGVGQSFTKSVSHAPLARQKIEITHSGKLVHSVQDQLAAAMNVLASLPDRMVIVKVKGMPYPFLLKVHEVTDPYVQRKMIRSQAWRENDIRMLLAKVHAAHSFYFKPGEEDEGEPEAQLIPFDRPKPPPVLSAALKTGTDDGSPFNE